MNDVTPAAEERQHHLYSPSTLQSREACPCYDSRSEANEKAIRGTLQHSMTETREDNLLLDDEEALAAAECLDFYDRQRLLFLDERQREVDARQSVSREGAVPDVEELIESYLPTDDRVFEDVRRVWETDKYVLKTIKTLSTTAGFVDRCIISWDRRRALMVDWKFGMWAVEDAKNNLQGIAYALGLFFKYPSLQTVDFYFVQPHIKGLSHAVFTRENTAALYLRVQVVVEQSREAHRRMLNDDWSMARPMTTACNFCANLGPCPKVAQFACTIGSKYYPLEIPGDITPTGLKSPKDALLGLRLAQVMANWADAFRRQISERVIRREAEMPAGYMMQTKSDRQIADPAKFREITLQYLTEAELKDLAEYGFTKLEDKIKEKAPRGSKKTMVEAYQTALLESKAVVKTDPYTFIKMKTGKDKD